MLPSDSPPSSLQPRSLQVYLALMNLRVDWQRRLLLIAASEASAALALAANAAGAAVLLTAESTAALREANQFGITDFNVTTLSEAVRILKNEIRKGQPVSVGVLDSHGAVWEETVARGLQPDGLVAESEQHAKAAQILCERGTQDLRFVLKSQAVPFHDLLIQAAGDWRERKDDDIALCTQLANLPVPQRIAAVRWVQAAARLFPRDLSRCYAAAWTASNEDG